MRKLIYVPVIHTEADMGTMSESLKKEYIRRFGPKKWEQHIRMVNGLWQGIETKLSRLNLQYELIKIYQDGLPNCGKELEIVANLAKKGSKNHRLILELVNKGARLVGTEDPALLLEEYKYIRKNLLVGTPVAGAGLSHPCSAAENLLEKRDEYISRRIDQTLNEGETGILFLGMMHRVDKKLPADIKTVFLIHHLPFGYLKGVQMVARTNKPVLEHGEGFVRGTMVGGGSND